MKGGRVGHEQETRSQKTCAVEFAVLLTSWRNKLVAEPSFPLSLQGGNWPGWSSESLAVVEASD